MRGEGGAVDVRVNHGQTVQRAGGERRANGSGHQQPNIGILPLETRSRSIGGLSLASGHQLGSNQGVSGGSGGGGGLPLTGGRQVGSNQGIVLASGRSPSTSQPISGTGGGGRFQPPRLATAARPAQRRENQRALRRTWRQQQHTEEVVRRAVAECHATGGGIRGGEEARYGQTVRAGRLETDANIHWDDPIRAAAEMAAAEIIAEEGGAPGSAGAARAAARRAAAAAASLIKRGYMGGGFVDDFSAGDSGDIDIGMGSEDDATYYLSDDCTDDNGGLDDTNRSRVPTEVSCQQQRRQPLAFHFCDQGREAVRVCRVGTVLSRVKQRKTQSTQRVCNVHCSLPPALWRTSGAAAAAVEVPAIRLVTLA